MNGQLMQVFLLTLPLLFLTGAHASAADDASPIPKASTERFLGNVPDFAGGKPSPNILYSTQAVGEAANGPGASTSKGSPSVLILDSRPAPRPSSSRKLTGGTIERRPVTPTPIQPHNVTSPWGQ